MKKTTFILVLLAFLFTLSSGITSYQDADISGTWVGETEVPDLGTDEFTLVIKKNDEQYSAVISDSLGMLDETECEDLEFKDNTITFHLCVEDRFQTLTIYVTLTVDRDTMSGYWETKGGTSVSIELERKKGM